MVESILTPTSIFETGNGIDVWQVYQFLPKNDRQESSLNWEGFVWEITSTFFSCVFDNNNLTCFNTKEYLKHNLKLIMATTPIQFYLKIEDKEKS